MIGYLESPLAAGRRLLNIDYDTYAAGEAELGWVNLTANIVGDKVDSDKIASDIVRAISDSVIEKFSGSIAHIKTSIMGDGTQSVANVVSNDSTVDVGLSSGREISGTIQIVVNARVAIDPKDLQSACEANVRSQVEKHGAAIQSMSAHSLRPGRPTPTHRVTS